MIVEDFRGKQVGTISIVGNKLQVITDNQKLKRLLGKVHALDYFSGSEEDGAFLTLSVKVDIKDVRYPDALLSYLGDNNFVLIK